MVSAVSNRQLNSGNTRFTLLAYLILLVVASLISLPMLLLTSFVIIGAIVSLMMASWKPFIARYAASTPLVLLGLSAVSLFLLGFAPAFALPLLGIAALVLMAGIGTDSFRSIAQVKISPAIPIMALVPMILLAFSANLFPGMELSWVMVGDGLPEYVYTLGLTPGMPNQLDLIELLRSIRLHNHMAVAISPINSPDSLSGQLVIAQAFVAIVVVSLIVGVTQLITVFGEFHYGIRGVVQGLVLGLMICSSAVVGQIASNGFINVGAAFPAYILVLSASFDLSRQRNLIILIVGIFGTVALVAIWPPLAMVAIGLLASGFLFPASPRLFVVASLVLPALVILSYWLASNVLGLTPEFRPSQLYHYFPVTPLSGFALLSLVLLLLVSSGMTERNSLVLIAAALGGGFAFVLAIGEGGFTTFLADSQVNNSTLHYHEQKFISQLFLPLLPMLMVIMMRGVFFARIGSRLAVGSIAFLLAASFLMSNTPNFPWFPLDGREAQQAIAKIVSDPLNSPASPTEPLAFNDNSQSWRDVLLDPGVFKE